MVKLSRGNRNVFELDMVLLPVSFNREGLPAKILLQQTVVQWLQRDLKVLQEYLIFTRENLRKDVRIAGAAWGTVSQDVI
jgi:hypothetical protein